MHAYAPKYIRACVLSPQSEYQMSVVLVTRCLEGENIPKKLTEFYRNSRKWKSICLEEEAVFQIYQQTTSSSMKSMRRSNDRHVCVSVKWNWGSICAPQFSHSIVCSSKCCIIFFSIPFSSILFYSAHFAPLCSLLFCFVLLCFVLFILVWSFLNSSSLFWTNLYCSILFCFIWLLIVCLYVCLSARLSVCTLSLRKVEESKARLMLENVPAVAKDEKGEGSLGSGPS